MGKVVQTAVTAKETQSAPKETTQKYSDDIIAGAIAGAVARLISAPFDVLKIRFQLQFADKIKYTSMLQAFTTVAKEEGILSLWKGNLSATYLWITYSMVQFSIYGLLKNIGMQSRDPFTGNLPPASAQSSISGSKINNKSGNNNNIRKSGEHSNLWRTIVLFLAGAGAGIIATTTTYPFDIMRTQFAVQGSTRVFPTMHSFIKNTLETKGVRGFYAGLAPALVGITPYMGLNFALYESLTSLATRMESRFRAIKDGQKSNTNAFYSISKNALCGGIAGGVSKLVVYPLDTIKKRMQIQVLANTLDGAASMPRYSSIPDLLRKTLRTEGVKGFYKGIIPTSTKAVVSTAVTFAAFDLARDVLKARRAKDKQ